MKLKLRSKESKSAKELAYEQATVAYLAIFDNTGYVGEMIPIIRKYLFPKELFYEIPVKDEDGLPVLDEDGAPNMETKKKFHSNPFRVLGRNVNDVIFLCREDSDTCVSPEKWFRDYYTEGSLLPHTFQTMQILAEIQRSVAEETQGMGIMTMAIAFLAPMLIGLLLNIVFLHAGYPH